MTGVQTCALPISNETLEQILFVNCEFEYLALLFTNQETEESAHGRESNAAYKYGRYRD